jgi:hypothetical protein
VSHQPLTDAQSAPIINRFQPGITEYKKTLIKPTTRTTANAFMKIRNVLPKIPNSEKLVLLNFLTCLSCFSTQLGRSNQDLRDFLLIRFLVTAITINPTHSCTSKKNGKGQTDGEGHVFHQISSTRNLSFHLIFPTENTSNRIGRRCFISVLRGLLNTLCIS